MEQQTAEIIGVTVGAIVIGPVEYSADAFQISKTACGNTNEALAAQGATTPDLYNVTKPCLLHRLN